MMDETTDELLSRYLDGDLSSTEEQRLKELLNNDPKLRAELDEMQDLQDSLRAVASRERPPEILDQMVRPLRQAGRPRRQRWAVAAILATAAVVVVGVIVVSEVGKTGWMPWVGKADSEVDQVFALSNLPSRDPDAPIGAIETLMAEEIPAPDFAEPKPLEVMGPLDRPANGKQWVLLVEGSEIFLPLNDAVRSEGLRLAIGVEQGRVTSCQTIDPLENSREVSDVCRWVSALERVGLADGRFEAVVAKWDGSSQPR